LLDEATYLKDWERGLKIVADEGKLKKATLIATGSHTAGIRNGGEPREIKRRTSLENSMRVLSHGAGRRGRDEHLDLMLLPLSFRRFLMARNPALENKLPAFEKWHPKALFAAAQEIAKKSAPLSSKSNIRHRSARTMPKRWFSRVVVCF
jgi:predicted AAA+ superfamily ATPase